MTTETRPDPVVEAWSDRLEEQLLEAGMESAAARAYRVAFELGLTRVISQTATRQELLDGLAELRQEIRDVETALRGEIGAVRGEIRDVETTLRKEMHDGFAELRKEIQDVETTLRKEMLAGFAELRGEIQGVEKALREEMGEQRRAQRDSEAALRQAMEAAVNKVRGELRFAMVIGFGMVGGMLGAVIALVA